MAISDPVDRNDRGEDRAASVRRLFNSIAPRYDLINDAQSFGLHRLWKRRLLTLGAVCRGERALDLCCGTGDIARALAGRGAEVTGLDFSLAMLEVARRRPPLAGAPPVWYVQGDALLVPFADNSFDLVTMGYGLRNLVDFEQGVREMFRLARPGGRVLVLDFGKPGWRPWRWLYFAYLRFVVPLFGLCFCGDAAAYAYILRSLKRYPAALGVSALLRAAGGRRVQVVSFLGGVMTIHYAEKAGVDEPDAPVREAHRAPLPSPPHENTPP